MRGTKKVNSPVVDSFSLAKNCTLSPSVLTELVSRADEARGLAKRLGMFMNEQEGATNLL
jgi:hypothetical protein